MLALRDPSTDRLPEMWCQQVPQSACRCVAVARGARSVGAPARHRGDRRDGRCSPGGWFDLHRHRGRAAPREQRGRGRVPGLRPGAAGPALPRCRGGVDPADSRCSSGRCRARRWPSTGADPDAPARDHPGCDCTAIPSGWSCASRRAVSSCGSRPTPRSRSSRAWRRRVSWTHSVDPIGVDVLGPTDGEWLLRAAEHQPLLDALAATPRPAGRLRIAVDPLRI